LPKHSSDTITQSYSSNGHDRIPGHQQLRAISNRRLAENHEQAAIAIRH
jgi:hypothetical protein